MWLLDRSSKLIFKLIGLDRRSKNQVTAEELHLVVASTDCGVLEESERAIISGIVRLADRPVREVMTPRTDVDWIDLDAEMKFGPSFVRIRIAGSRSPTGRSIISSAWSRPVTC